MESPPTPARDTSEDSTPTAPRSGIRGIVDNVVADMRSNNGGPTFTGRDLFTLVSISVILTIFYYYGRPGYLRRNHWDEAAELFGWDRGHEYFELVPYMWWAVTSIVIRMVLPCLIIVFVFKDHTRNYGYRIKGEVGHARIYLLMYAVMLPVVVAASFLPGFQDEYPLYAGAIGGIDHFAIYQVCYGIQFIALEAFFRGFIIFALFKRFGYYSVVIMTIPYCMIHFGKPMPETLAAIVAGLVLGYLALKSKSWLYGALLHWAIGITMDLLSIFHKGGFTN